MDRPPGEQGPGGLFGGSLPAASPIGVLLLCREQLAKKRSEGGGGHAGAGDGVADDAELFELGTAGRRERRLPVGGVDNVRHDICDGEASASNGVGGARAAAERILDGGDNDLHEGDTVEAAGLAVGLVVEKEHLAHWGPACPAAHNLFADAAEQQHGRETRPERADAVDDGVAACEGGERAGARARADLLTVGGDVDEARDGARERGHVAVVLLEVELRAAEGRVDRVLRGGRGG